MSSSSLVQIAALAAGAAVASAGSVHVHLHDDTVTPLSDSIAAGPAAVVGAQQLALARRRDCTAPAWLWLRPHERALQARREEAERGCVCGGQQPR